MRVTEVERKPVDWDGALSDRSLYNPKFLQSRDRLADAAKAGDWSAVLAALDDPNDDFRPRANAWRIGGTSWFSPLHQVAWQGAPVSVAVGLIDRGAWRTLRDAKGRRPVDIAIDMGHGHLRDVLEPIPCLSLHGHAEVLTGHLGELVKSAVREVQGRDIGIRPLDVRVLAERGDEVWFPVPGMYGGFHIGLQWGRVHVQCWSRVSGGSGRYWVILDDGPVLVEEGFV